MRNAALSVITATVIPALVLAACGKKDEEPPPAQGGYQQPPPGQQPYGQQPPAQPGTYGQQPAPAPQPQPTAAPAPQPQPQPTATATGGQMSTPGALAPACQDDSTCLTHKCNVAAGKCAMPCTPGNDDCLPGNTCMHGACVPGAPPAQ